MARTIAQIIKAAQEGGAHNLTPAEFAVLQKLERQKADKKAAAEAASVSSEPDPASIRRRSKGGKGWYTREEMGNIFGMNGAHFKRQYGHLIDQNDIDEEKVGKNKKTVITWYRSRGVIDAYVESKMPKRTGDDLDEFSDADSPALERYRSLKADMAELDLEERKASLVPLDHVKGIVGILANAVRALSERAQRKYGRELGLMFEEALDGAEAMMETKYGGTKKDHQSGDAGGNTLDDGPGAVPNDPHHADVRRGGNDPADRTAQGKPLPV